jgi:hypothetical protein
MSQRWAARVIGISCIRVYPGLSGIAVLQCRFRVIFGLWRPKSLNQISDFEIGARFTGTPSRAGAVRVDEPPPVLRSPESAPSADAAARSFSLALAGSGGAGVMTAGTLLLDAAARAGLYGLMVRTSGPQIRGGEAAALLRLGDPSRWPRWTTASTCCWRSTGRTCTASPTRSRWRRAAC